MADIISSQVELFLISVAGGIGVGIWYEIFRSFRKCIKHVSWQVHVEDIVFGMGTFLGIFILLQKYNHGSLRLYVFLGIALGCVFYFSAWSVLVSRLLGLIWDTLFFLYRNLFRSCLVPFKIIVNSLAKSLKKTAETVRIIKSKK